MRHVLAALALAGALSFFSPDVSADGRFINDDRYQAAQFAPSAWDMQRYFSECRAPRTSRCSIRPAPAKKQRKHAPGNAMLAMIDAAAAAEGILSDLARALVTVESGGNPLARDKFGSLGLTQIKCQTARGLGFAGPCAALFDPAVNLKWGLRHAHLALKRGSIGFHQAGLHARRVSRAYVARIHAAMR